MNETIGNGPYFYNEKQTVQELGGGVRRKILAYGENLMTVEVLFETGARGAVHTHPHTQITYVVAGRFRYNVGGKEADVAKGDTVYIDPDVPHGCVCLEAGRLVDIFTPMREDFLK